MQRCVLCVSFLNICLINLVFFFVRSSFSVSLVSHGWCLSHYNGDPYLDVIQYWFNREGVCTTKRFNGLITRWSLSWMDYLLFQKGIRKRMIRFKYIMSLWGHVFPYIKHASDTKGAAVHSFTRHYIRLREGAAKGLEQYMYQSLFISTV